MITFYLILHQFIFILVPFLHQIVADLLGEIEIVPATLVDLQLIHGDIIQDEGEIIEDEHRLNGDEAVEEEDPSLGGGGERREFHFKTAVNVSFSEVTFKESV